LGDFCFESGVLAGGHVGIHVESKGLEVKRFFFVWVKDLKGSSLA
jgi:hypothetical protein